MLENALDVLKTAKSFAVIGVSQDLDKYGHEVFAALLSAGIRVYPINPKYSEVDGRRCYPSLTALPESPDVVVLALGPAATQRVIPDVIDSGVKTIWMPPGCFTPAAVEACRSAGIRELHDICPVFATGMLRASQEAEER